MPSAIVWDATGEKRFETGTDHGVLFVANGTGYDAGVAWNGLTAVTESPSGAEPTDLWADNIKYATLRSAEDFGATIEAYTYPDEFMQCDGSAEPADGVIIGQQGRKGFGFSYRTLVRDDQHIDSTDRYKIHLVYGASANPSERNYQTVNDSPDAIQFSWEITTVPVNVTGHKPTAHLIVDSTKVDATKLAAFEKILYGSNEADSRLPLPDEIITMFA